MKHKKVSSLGGDSYHQTLVLPPLFALFEIFPKNMAKRPIIDKRPEKNQDCMLLVHIVICNNKPWSMARFVI